MKYIALILISMLFAYAVNAQNNDKMHAFFNQDSTLVGYKNAKGEIVIPAKIDASLGIPDSFQNIISVIEPTKDDRILSYFLTKEGKRVGKDSLYMFDNVPDCENEGFIRFRDQKTDKMGLLNSKGEIQITAIYSHIDRVKNGMIAVLKDAVRKKTHPGSEYTYWEGGNTFLIDTNNNVLIEKFPIGDELNFHLVSIDGTYIEGDDWEKFTNIDGKKFAFLNFEKALLTTIKQQFALDIREELLSELCFDTITYWTNNTSLQKKDAMEYLDENFDKIKPILQGIMDGSADYFISKSHLNTFIFDSPAFYKYINHCGDAKDWEYPVYQLVINNFNGNKNSQKSLDFLWTDEGFRLIMASLD